MKVIDLFAGRGGIAEGFRQAGFTSEGFVEWWEPAQNTFKKNFPESKLIGNDITLIPDEEISKYTADVIVGGPPCQGFSMAGKRDPNDKRNTLFEHYLRFVKIIQPKYCVMENVKGIYTMRAADGEPVFNKITRGFKELGYSVQAKIVNASNYGVPEARERVIFIACKDQTKIKHPDHVLEKKVAGDVLNLPYEEIKEIQHIYQKNHKMLYKAHYLRRGQVISTFHAAGKKINPEKPSPTITKGGRFIHPRYNRYLSVREVARLQSFPDNFNFCGNIQQMYGQIGNAVPPLLAKAIALKIKEQEGSQ